MFWWFKRANNSSGTEARRVSSDVLELIVRRPDGSEHVEVFAHQDALLERQRALDEELTDDGWTGPPGWKV